MTYFHSSRYICDLANGDICLAVGYCGDVMQAQSRAEDAGKSVDSRYLIPKQGANLWFDMLAIPRDARHADGTHALIDYLLRPDVIAPVSDYVGYANPNKDATAPLAPSVRDNPGIYPADQAIATLYVCADLPAPIQRIITGEWIPIKTGR